MGKDRGPEAGSAVAFGRAEPQIFVGDVQAASVFYRDKLGFKVEFLYGTPPYYGQVSRGGSYLNLRCVASPIPEPGARDAQELFSASILVRGIDAVAAEFAAAGVAFFKPIATQPWGARTCIVRDLDGNLLLFAE